MESQYASDPPGQPTPQAPAQPPDETPFDGQHLTTFTYEGRFWDVYMEFVDDPHRPDSCRARLCYVPTDRADHESPARTAVIIIESSYEEALGRARSLDQHQLGSMLRSIT